MNRIYEVDYHHPTDSSLFFPDLIRLGLDLAISLPSDLHPNEFCFLTDTCELAVTRVRRLGPNGLSLSLPVAWEGRLLGHAQLDLVARPCLTGIHCAGASALSFNPISLTRSLMFPDVTAKSVGGQTNFVPNPEALNAEFLGRTFDMTAYVVSVARQAIEDLLPAGCQVFNDRAWLQAAEAAHDFTHPDAFRVTQIAMQSALNQSRITRHDVYQAGTSYDRVPVARFKPRRAGETTKVYPKTRDIVRVEVSCPNRESVKQLCGTESSRFDGDHVAELLDGFMASAHEIGRAALGEVKALAENARPLPELARCLHPLLLAAEGQPVSGGYRLKQADRIEAERAYQDLMLEGRHWAKTAKPGSSLRRLFDSLCGVHGPLTNAARGPWYFLKCDFSRAAPGSMSKGGSA